MKIAIDARESGTSTGRYIDKLVVNLHGLDLDYEIIILTKKARIDFFKQQAPRFQVVECPHQEFTFDEQLGFKKQLDGLNADLVHFGMVQQPVLYRGKAVTTIHDLTTMRFINHDVNLLVFKAKQQVYKWVIRQAVKKSAAIIAISQFVKDDLVVFTGVNPDKVTVTLEAGDFIDDQREEFKPMAGKKFIMYVGRPATHKNLERLISAFEELQTTHPDLHLVLAGKKDANYQRIEAGVRAKNIKNICFTDFVSEGQLRWLYENCQAYIFPSLSEGFGLPGLEAMAHGAPVVSSNATCLPEVYGQAVHYFDPEDVADMAKAIGEVLDDTVLRDRLIKAGAKHIKNFSWRRMAEQTAAVYRQALNS